MPTDINGFRPRTLETNDSKTGLRPDSTTGRSGASPSTAPAVGNTDSVNLTEAATRLQQLSEMMPHVPEIDSARVDALRQAIAEGRYQVDAVHVTDKLIALERTLFDTSKR